MTWQPDPRVRKRLGMLYAAILAGKDLDTSIFKDAPEVLRDLGGGKIACVGELQLDTDGWPEGGGPGGDPYWQKDTSLRYADGSSLNANRVPYFVLPLEWYAAHGAKSGDLGAFLFKDRIVFAIFGDQGPKDKIGEGSVELLRQLGFERVRPDGSVINAGTDPGIVGIVFCGSAKSGKYAGQTTLLDDIATRGRALFDAAGGATVEHTLVKQYAPGDFAALKLHEAFCGPCATIFNAMAAAGHPLVCNVASDTLRDPWTQARYWRRSRSDDKAAAKILELEGLGAPYLAKILRDVGHQAPGSWQTDAVPGASYHQHGLAIDAYPKDPVSGKTLWLDPKIDGANYPLAVKAYDAYEGIIKQAGMYWGGYFTTPDSGHFQISGAKCIDYVGGWKKADAMIAEKWTAPPA